MPNVYIIQNNPGFDFTDAFRFGKRVDVFPPGTQVYGDATHYVDIARAKLRNCTPDDYLVLVGDPTMIAIAFAEMVRRNDGIVRVLKWDGRRKQYVETVVDMEAQPT